MLKLESVSKRFGGIQAVNQVSLALGQTPITGLVGPNGSGKTTLFHLITGFYQLDSGRVFFNDRALHRLKPHRISRRGLVRTFQHSRMLTFMTVKDNLMAAAQNQLGESLWPLFAAPGRVRRRESQVSARADEILALLKLDHLADDPAGNLSYGQRKLLELGRVLMAKPRLVLLDEPTAGVNPTLIRQLVALILELSQSGVQFFLVEHNMPLVTELCRRLLVMDAGKLIFSGTPTEALADDAVIEAYLGKVAHAADGA